MNKLQVWSAWAGIIVGFVYWPIYLGEKFQLLDKLSMLLGY